MNPPAPRFRVIEGGRDRQEPARPEARAFAAEIARIEIAAIMARHMPDSPSPE